MSVEIGDTSILEQKTVDIPEHEVLLSFRSDEDAVRFNYWWQDVGEVLFVRDAPSIEV